VVARLSTITDDGVFRELYRGCNCCKLNLHSYQYPLNSKTKLRTLTTCISCKRDCRDSKQCQLGVLHDA
jgi:hypothetical protein